MIMLGFYFGLLAINLVLCFLLLKNDIRSYNPAAIMWFVIVSSFLIPSIADPFAGLVAAHPFSVSYYLDISTLIEAQLFVFLFLAVFYFVYFVRNMTNKRLVGIYAAHYKAQLWGGSASGLTAYSLFLMLALLGFYEAYSKYGSSIFSSFSFTQRREGLSAISGFVLSYNLLVSAGVLFWLVMRKKFLSSALYLVMYLFIYFVMGGSRQPLIVLLLPFVFYFFSSKKMGFVYAIVLSLSFSLISKVLEFVIYVRNTSGLSARIDTLLEFPSFLFSVGERLGSREEDLRFAFYYFVKKFDGLEGFGDFTYFMRVMFFWLPSSLDGLALKPADFEYTMFAHYMPGFEGTMHPTLFGSLYADSGWIVIPWIVFFVFLLLITGPVLRCFRGIPYFSVWALFSYTYMMMARGAIYGPFVVLVFGLVFAVLVQKFSKTLVQR
ncbi:hypothetical protein [Pseudomonas sp. NFACC39-1]|uniref:hypothetical protein n=1 Tax=Pseudomonas sp. NFACC39-1 TaxID=1566195 RepID=UPI0008D5A8F7|nr:hypothetical protein [Pseudomonas sp. NFACC39-1]SEO25548.1 hypothetical protein SAMN03159293_02374 [Pseudomonas sp. NFACC39-1]